MKRCPQCQSAYDEENLFCFYDGKALIKDIPVEEINFSPPPGSQDPTVVFSIPSRGPAGGGTAPKIAVNKYFTMMLVGLLLGVGLVLGVVFLIVTQTKSQGAGTAVLVSEKHREHNKTRKDSEFNGFVLTNNANLRSAPGSPSIADVLPENDRLKIIERQSPNSPWYRVECEHGTVGWMHGNTIDWSPEARPF